VVAAEIRVIARELGCTAVRVTGGDPERIGVAARAAAAEGLEVWFSRDAGRGERRRLPGPRQGLLQLHRHHVRQLTVIGDGAAWIWNLAAATFAEATHIVDLRRELLDRLLIIDEQRLQRVLFSEPHTPQSAPGAPVTGFRCGAEAW
jgi:hypothetical protein